jgi:alanine dehydrogenase
MVIGLVKEIKKHEYRVGLTPNDVKAYIKAGHQVLVETNAGIGAGFSNEDYESVGAVLTNKEKVFEAQMIVKVKEPLKEEYNYFKEGQILYTYLHLAANKELTLALMEKKVSAFAYETITDDKGLLPCLKPMSEIAGRLAVQEGAKYLEKPMGGRGVLLGGVSGVKRGNVVIIGGGVVGLNACKMAVGLGANVTMIHRSGDRLAFYDDIFGSKVTTLFSNEANIKESIMQADLVVGAVLIPGASAPKLISKEDLTTMKKGSVIVDVSIDQGGCFQTSRATYHDEPTYMVNDVVHYCVANMPGAVSLTSTLALTATTLKYGLEIAQKGVKRVCENPHIRNGLNIYNGHCMNEPVAKSLDLTYVNELI